MKPLFVLFLVFLVLKLCNIITWSWWLVTLPLWLSLAYLVGIIVAFVVAATILHKKIRRKRNG
jgi:hypothetical protein